MCGDDLTRANIMKQAANLKDFTPDTLLPGVKINTSATDFAPIEQLQMMRFKGEKWETVRRRSSAARSARTEHLIFRRAVSFPRNLRLNIAPATPSRGFLLLDEAERYSMLSRAAKRSNQKKMTHPS